MDDIGRVHEKKASQELVDKILYMVFAEFLSWVDDSMQISFHKLSDDVNIVVAGSSLGPQNVD